MDSTKYFYINFGSSCKIDNELIGELIGQTVIFLLILLEIWSFFIQTSNTFYKLLLEGITR